MKYTKHLAGVLLGSTLTFLVACQSTKGTTDGNVVWGYTGSVGPEHWGELSPKYRLASEGKSQSPIDIDTSAVSPGAGDVSVQCTASVTELVNNGHSIQANANSGGTLTTPTGTYHLKQFHFHSPSEHTIDGKNAAMEMHMVHADDAGNLAVVSVMIQEGSENPFFAKLWPHIPAIRGSNQDVDGTPFGPGDLLPAGRKTWRYSGSLTTPPCSEDVDWTVMQEPVEASAAQIAKFREIMYRNNRPTQPLNGRAVQSGD